MSSNPQLSREIKAFLFFFFFFQLIKCCFLLTNDILSSPAAPLPQELNQVQQYLRQGSLPNSSITFMVKIKINKNKTKKKIDK